MKYVGTEVGKIRFTHEEVPNDMRDVLVFVDDAIAPILAYYDENEGRFHICDDSTYTINDDALLNIKAWFDIPEMLMWR